MSLYPDENELVEAVQGVLIKHRPERDMMVTLRFYDPTWWGRFTRTVDQTLADRTAQFVVGLSVATTIISGFISVGKILS